MIKRGELLVGLVDLLWISIIGCVLGCLVVCWIFSLVIFFCRLFKGDVEIEDINFVFFIDIIFEVMVVLDWVL